MEKIILTTTKQEKKQGFKNAWRTIETTTQEVTRKEHHNATNEDTRKWFKRLGGKESAIRAYTCAGYVVIESKSTSPDGQLRTIREYNFTDK